MKKEAVKNYPSSAITSAIKEYATKLGLDASVQELGRKEMANIKYKMHRLLEVHLICDFDLKSDISKSISFLVEKRYHVKSYYVSYQSTKSTKGIVCTS